MGERAAYVCGVVGSPDSDQLGATLVLELEEQDELGTDVWSSYWIQGDRGLECVGFYDRVRATSLER